MRAAELTICLIWAPWICGCAASELLMGHVEPGGMVTVTMNGGPPRSSTALAGATQDPLETDGFSTFLTFGLIADVDTFGRSARADLAGPGAAIEVDLPSGSRTHLESHADGTGCVAQIGVIHLRVDANGTLAGDFSANGTAPGGGACHIDGAISGVPIVR